MNKFLIGLFLICAGSIAGLTLLMADDLAAPVASPSVDVKVESGKVAVIDRRDTTLLQSGQQATSDSAGTIVLAAPAATPVLKAGGGSKAIAGSTPAASEPMEAVPSQTIALASEPQSSKTNTPQAEETSAAPEYLCSFEIIVNSKKEADGNPAPIKPISNVDVILWKGQDCPRPIVDTIQIPLHVFNKGNQPAVLTRKNDGIVVTNYSSKETPSNEEPYQGDRLIGIDGYTYLSGTSLTNQAAHIYIPATEQDNKLLRVWDTLAAYSQLPIQAQSGAFLFFAHKGQEEPIIGHLCEPANPQTKEIVAQGTTDSQGRCLFNNLPPGIYFVQARKGNQRSFISTLSPVRRGVKMWLGNPDLMVMVEKKGVEITRLRGIQGAQVQLEAIDKSGKGLFMETTEQMGIARFNDIPWGTYRLTTTLPAEIQKPPQTRTVEFEALYQKEIVEFETPEQIHELAGKVLRKDTHEPVKDFTIDLVLKAELNGEKIYGIGSTKTKTAADGSFRFTQLVEGVYELASGYTDDYNGFLVEGDTLLPSRSGWTHGGVEVRVDKDIAGYKYVVLPGVETKFSGQAVNADGSPATKVSFRFDEIVVLEREGKTREVQRQIPTIPDSPQTDENGNFEFSFIATPDSKIQKGVIMAAIDKEPAPEAKTGMSVSESGGGYGMMMGGMGGIGSRGSQPGVPLAEASYPIEFKRGDTKSGLHIVLKTIDPYVIEGKLTSEDGGLPDGLQICAYYQNQFYYAKIDRESNYRLEVPKAGKVELQIAGSSLCGTQLPGVPDKYGILTYEKYCSEFPTVEVSDENRTVRLDVNFVKGYFFLGRVLDKNQNPIKEAWIQAISPSTVDPNKEKTESYGVSQTNAQGYFSIAGLRRNLEHRIIVRTKMDGEILAQMDGVVPEPKIGDNVILFTVEKPQ